MVILSEHKLKLKAKVAWEAMKDYQENMREDYILLREYN
jgi:hypothetical protein